ncbi:hypothetical protein ABT297_20925 [Dactylosporangium sp. NPDC000555]|uniref:hypothetical protein n=1 Tax=Dactylosporangium sp. NPDC000555 TaxID=3154260 RepID=UPI00332DFC5D
MVIWHGVAKYGRCGSERLGPGDDRGFLWQRYRGRTFVAIIGSLVLMFAYALLADKLGMHAEARPIQLSIGISFIGEALAVTRRGLVLNVPFAPERR